MSSASIACPIYQAIIALVQNSEYHRGREATGTGSDYAVLAPPAFWSLLSSETKIFKCSFFYLWRCTRYNLCIIRNKWSYTSKLLLHLDSSLYVSIYIHHRHYCVRPSTYQRSKELTTGITILYQATTIQHQNKEIYVRPPISHSPNHPHPQLTHPPQNLKNKTKNNSKCANAS